VNWNSGAWLRSCLESLITATNAQIIVVDNASADESIELAIGLQGRVDFIRNTANRGLAAAMNQAFRATGTPYVLMLNPDIRVVNGAIAKLENVMAEHPRAGAVGGYVNEKYLPRPLPTAGSLIRQNLGLSRRSVARQSRGPAYAVDQPAAAALLIRRAAYEEIGGFDEQFYPAWYEDVDFCKRLKAASWEVYFAPNAEFLHEGGYSARALGAAGFAEAYYRNQLRYTSKHLGPSALFAVRWSIVAGMVGRMAVRPGQARAHVKAILGALGQW
jgi:GT2 family glycosyltransferase